MANIKSFPNNQDVYIGAEDVMKWLHGRTSGVFGANNNASVSALSNPTMAVTVSDGLGWMANVGKDGVVWWIDNEATSGSKLQLNIEQADGALNRIDRIIVEWKTTNYVDYPEIKVLKGNTSSKATAPALTNNSTVRQISLAKINVAAGTTAITASMITDERLDSSVCGLVTESVSVDTTTIQKQFEELLTAIQKELLDLNNDTAALLKAGGTMYGALDMGGNKIKNVAHPTDDNDAVPKIFLEETLENFESGISMVLLWENGSIASDFVGGNKITHSGFGNESEYQMLVICTEKTTLIVPNKASDAGLFASYVSMIATSAYYVNSRGFDVKNGYINVRDNFQATVSVVGGTTTSTMKANQINKPNKIYGMKGVG